MKSRKTLCALSTAVLAGIGVHRASATIITQWSFSSTVAAPDNSPAPSTGTGTAVSLGMTNDYTYAGGEGPGSVTDDDITSVSGSSLSEETWRIRGNSNTANSGPGEANGWNNSAPNYTQGAEFDVSTAGYSQIGLSFDWFCTTYGVGNMQVQYSLDGGSTWSNLGSDLIATSNDFYGAATGSPTNTFDLSSISGADNNPDFEVRMVSVRPVPADANYASTTDGDGNYAPASTKKGDDFNNSSGNWSFENITITGTPIAVPEPASAALLGLSGLALLKRRRAK